MDNGNITAFAFVDTVDHHILLDQLLFFGVGGSGTDVHWFKFYMYMYLSDRFHYVAGISDEV